MFIRVYINGEITIEKDIPKDVVTIGRANNSDIRVKLPEVSSEHLEITENETEFLVIDKNSMNGTFIDGQKLKPFKTYELRPNISLHIAKSIALEVLVSSPDHQYLMTTESPEVKTTATSTEKLGLDFTGLNKIRKPEKVSKFKARPMLVEPSSDKDTKKGKTYLLEIIAFIVVAGLVLSYLNP